MMKHKVSELSGALLDAEVALAEGDRLPDYWRDPDDGTCWLRPGREVWEPSARWDQGGPIIERERIGAYWIEDESQWRAGMDMHGYTPEFNVAQAHGPTRLIASMRAFVASKFGYEVELP